MNGAVEEAVVRVQVKMDEVLALHAAGLSRIIRPIESELIRRDTISRGVTESTKQHIELCYLRVVSSYSHSIVLGGFELTS